MKLKGIEKWVDGKYAYLYKLKYETKSGKEKIYEMVSRDGLIEDVVGVRGKDANAVIILAFNKDHSKIVMNKEFRMAVDNYVYNLPAGLVEPHESFKEAASRELFEETGLTLVNVIDVLPATYSSVGLSNEKTIMFICEVEGEFDVSNIEDCEDIEPFWVSKEDAENILNDTKVLCGARTQMLLYMWVHSL